MFKKLLFVILLLVPFSAFAGADTDRICADNSLHWKINQDISVYYPWETVSVWTVWKSFYSFEPENTYMPEGEERLYYVVNIRSKKLAEFYSYNCGTQKPSLLMKIKIDSSETYYNLDFSQTDNFVLVWRDDGIALGSTHTIIAYNVRSNKKLFAYKNTKWLMSEWEISGFVSWKWAWFIYLSNIVGLQNDTLYRIDKKDRKATEM